MDINTIFKPKSKIGRMILFISGILLILLSIFLFNCAINKPLSDFDNLFKILISPELGVVGMIFILTSFNIKNIRSNVGLSIIVAIILGLLIFSSSSIIPILVLVLDIIIFIVITFLAKSFVTVVTLSVYSLIWLIIAAALLNKMPSYYYVITYSCITLCLITYLCFGTKINNLFIIKMWWGEELELYNYEYLKENLTVIYITIFVILNVSAALYNDKFGFYNLINNSFITAITITQINWSKIFNFREKQDGNKT